MARWAGSVIKGRSSRLSAGDRPSFSARWSYSRRATSSGYIPGPFRIDPPEIFQADVNRRSISPIVTHRSKEPRHRSQIGVVQRAGQKRGNRASAKAKSPVRNSHSPKFSSRSKVSR